MNDDNAILVVGADGMIGRALANRLAGEGRTVLRTTLLPEPGAEVLDLARQAESWSPPRPVGTVFLCAAMTSLDYCRRQPAESRAINVLGTVALARRLARHGRQIISLSSNLVFDGAVAHQRADAAVCPRTEYGRQKAEAERELLGLGGACVVRFTKVLGQGTPLLTRWADAMRAGEKIRPFSDMVMAPVPLEFAVEALAAVAKTRTTGIVQVSAAQDVSYAEAARHVAKCIHAPHELIQPIAAAQSGIELEHLPANTTLDTSRLRMKLGLIPPNVWTAIERGMRP
jgi:dTDP-4-dehydrorhamnose reductase